MVRRQGGASGRAGVLPHGRFLRAVLRRRRSRRRRARHRADPARRAQRHADADVRRAAACRRGLSRAPDPPRLPRRRGRADGGPQVRGPARRRSGARWCGWSRPARSPRKRCWRPAAPTCCWLWRSGARRHRRRLARRFDRPVRDGRAPASAELPGLLGRLEPAEILAPSALALGDWDDKRAPETAPSPPLVARRRLAEAFGVASLDAFGSFTDAEAIAALMAVDYVRATQAGTLPRLARPVPQGSAGLLAMDAATRASLEIHRARDGGVAAHAVRHGAADADPGGCAAAGGWLGGAADRPGGDRGAAGCVGLAARRTATPPPSCALLCAPRPDIARALGRLSVDRGGPRDLAAMRDGLRRACAATDARTASGWTTGERQCSAEAGRRVTPRQPPAALASARTRSTSIQPWRQHWPRRWPTRRRTGWTTATRSARLRRRTRRRTRAARRQPPRAGHPATRLCAALRRRQPEDPPPRPARLRHRGARRRGREAARRSPN